LRVAVSALHQIDASRNTAPSFAETRKTYKVIDGAPVAPGSAMPLHTCGPDAGRARRSLGEGGFTLVESLVAASLVACALVAVAYLAALGIRQTTATRRSLAAVLAAQSKLEQLAADRDAGGGEEAADAVRLRWAIAPIDPADASFVSVVVCAYAPEDEDRLRPEACVATLRANGR
jgi:hypothetical protein